MEACMAAASGATVGRGRLRDDGPYCGLIDQVPSDSTWMSEVPSAS